MQKIKVKQMVSYSGHSVRDSGVVNLSLKSPYSELVNSVKDLQMLNNNIVIKARLDNESITIGSFMIKQIAIDGDGESKLSFNSTVDYVELDNLNKLPLTQGNEFWILLVANVEEEKDKESKLDYGERE